jgi:hypothetical protein
MPYCPVCNLFNVAEDHSIRFHRELKNTTNTIKTPLVTGFVRVQDDTTPVHIYENW